jgi:hypothetical protein
MKVCCRNREPCWAGLHNFSHPYWRLSVSGSMLACIRVCHLFSRLSHKSPLEERLQPLGWQLINGRVFVGAAYRNAVREQRLAAEISSAKRERDFYLSKVDQSRAFAAMDERRKKVRASWDRLAQADSQAAHLLRCAVTASPHLKSCECI